MNLVAYALSMDDYDALTQHINKKGSQLAVWFGLWGTPFAASVISFMMLTDMWKKAGLIPKDIYVLGTYSAAVFWLGMGFLYRFAVALDRRRFRKKQLGCEVKMLIAPPGIAMLLKDGEESVYWQSIESVEETYTHIFLFLNKKKAFTVPKAAFTSSDKAHAFGALARKFWQQAHPSPTVTPVPPIAAP